MRAGSTENFLDSNLIQQVFRKNLSVEALNERLRKRFMEFDVKKFYFSPKKLTVKNPSDFSGKT